MKILFITLSNLGDAVLSLPALDLLTQSFPKAQITVICGERTRVIFENNPGIERAIVFNKRAGIREKIRLFFELKNERFDAVVDLRNSLFGMFLPAKYKISPFIFMPAEIRHMKDRHIFKAGHIAAAQAAAERKSLHISAQDEEYVSALLRKSGIGDNERFAVISPGARSHIKRWPADKFTELIPRLAAEFKLKIILAGDKDDTPITEYIAKNAKTGVFDFAGKTTILQLAALLKKSACVITNDSAILHLASYLELPVAAIFGPTNQEKYGPWSRVSAVAKKDIFCRPCEDARCRFGTLECLRLVKVEDALRAVKYLLDTKYDLRSTMYEQYKRILIVRTDRIGDVLLSTPVIKALRDSFAHAYIAMMVSPYAKDIVEGNPYLDEVILYDKDGKHKSWQRSYKFAHNLKKKRFDLAIILHPTNRAHLIVYFSGIPRRIGYGRKLGFLLTDRIKHTKQYGDKHELEYNLDLIRYLGLDIRDRDIFMPIRESSEKYAEELFSKEGIRGADKLLAIHPGASCPSKVWPNERFALVADKLAQEYGFKILLVSGPKDVSLALKVAAHMRHKAINLAGMTSVSQLASVIKRCALFISNDSGPVHIASALGAPVISIFGRSQKGLSPKRWAPLGLRGRILHKDVGCIECLAHNCRKEFACLKAITVEDVVSVAKQILENS